MNKAAAAAHSPFGGALKQARGLHGMSQLTLALEAGVSARHVSFIESGRARPSRPELEQAVYLAKLSLWAHGLGSLARARIEGNPLKTKRTHDAGIIMRAPAWGWSGQTDPQPERPACKRKKCRS